MLSIRGLTKIYQAVKGASVEALSSVSADFGDKGLVFLLGKSGSGKSTMLNLLGGFDMPTSGEIIVNGRSSASFSKSDFDSYRNTFVGFVFQEYNLIENYTVGTNIGLALELQGKKADRADIDALLRTVDLVERGETLYDRHVDELSGGQKQRVAIARALIKSPEIILADEPTGALDSVTGEQLYDLLKKLSKEKLIIVVSHDRANAEKYGDRVIELSDGKVIRDTAPIPLSKIVRTKDNSCNFIKSRLPVKRSFLMGASALKARPIRLIVSIFLSVIAFVIFGFALTASTADELTAELVNLHDNGQHMVTLNGAARNSSGRIVGYAKSFSPSQLEVIKKYNNGKDPMVVYYSNIYIGNYLNGMNYYFQNDSYESIFNYSSLRVVEIDSTTGETDAMLAPDARFANKTLCRLPSAADEIAITDFHAQMFIDYGYVEYDESNTNRGDPSYTPPAVIPIKTPDDLIGLSLGKYKITGVYSTEQDLDFYKTMHSVYEGQEEYIDMLSNGAMASTIAYGFIWDDPSVTHNRITSVLIRLSGDFSKDSALFHDLSYKIGDTTYASVALSSVYSGFISAASIFFGEIFIGTATFFVILFSIFAVLLTMNFLSVSIDFKKKELGILRALGARTSDMLKICLAESLLIAGIELVISIIAVFVVCAVVNNILVSIFYVGFVPILGLMLLALGMSALATTLPIRKLAKRKPIDVINNKEK